MSRSDALAPIDRIILPLDGMNEAQALKMVDAMLATGITTFKVGKSLINRGVGGTVARHIIASGGDVFWDNKDRDITNTMVDAAIAANELRVAMFNVFADAGPEKLKRVKAVKGSALVLAVTVLTDMNDADCREIYETSVDAAVTQFAAWAGMADLDGIVCSAADLQRLEMLRIARHLLKVCPGIRPQWAAANDQKRITTPREAIQLGADYLVIGRPITAPPSEIGSPVEAVKWIVEEIETALSAA